MGSCSLLLLLFALDLEPLPLPGESRPTATRYAEAMRLLEANKTAEGIAQLLGILDAGAEDLLPLSPTRSLRARDLVHAALVRLPADALREYRARMEPLAAKWLEAGDEQRVVTDAFLTPSALLALDRLGDQAFLQGDLETAEHYWATISPLESYADRLSHPATTAAQAARAQAKQLLARRFAGRSDYSAALAAYRKRYPEARGRLAGHEGNYADILEKTIATPPKSQDWTTFAGNTHRAALAIGPERILDTLSRLGRKGPTFTFDLSRRDRFLGGPASVRRDHAVSAARRLAYHPVLVGSTALVNDGRCVTAYDLKTGKAEVWLDAADYLRGVPRVVQPLPREDIRHTLSVAQGHVFARLGASSIRDVRPSEERGDEDAESLLACLKEGKVRWLARAYDPKKKEFAVFEGSPLVIGERCFVAVSRFQGDKLITALHCYAAFSEEARPAPLWKVDICETRELLTADAIEGRKARLRHHLLTQAGNLVVYCSHSGLIVAVDALRGTRVWGVRYPRRELAEPADEPSLRDLAPPLLSHGRLYVAPADSDRVLCLEPTTGETLWQRDQLDVVHLLGVGQGRLLFSTWRDPTQGRTEAGGLRAVDAFTGRDDTGWMLPDDGAGLIPFGRGLLIGNLVLWPTFRQPFGVLAVRQEDGRQPDNPTLLHRIRSGNLVFANGILLVTDRQAMYAYVPEDPPSEAPEVPGDADRVRLQSLLRQKKPQAILDDPTLARLDIRDENGLPQAAGSLAWQAKPLPPWKGDRFAPGAFRLHRDETFLPLAGGDAFLTARPGYLLRREGSRICWQTALPFTPHLAMVCGSLILAAGAEGIAGLSESGERVWHWPAPALPSLPTDAVASPRVHLCVLPPEPLHRFCLGGDRLFVAQGGRIFALNTTSGRCIWSWDTPGAGLDLPPPCGRVHHLLPLGEVLVAQVSRQRLTFDAATGRILDRHPDAWSPWPTDPVPLPGGEALVVEANRLRKVNPRGQIQWTYRIPGHTTRTGEPPVVLPWGKVLVVAIPENIGMRLRFVDVQTGMLSHRDAPRIVADPQPGGWLIAKDRLFHSDQGRLVARELPSARLKWSRRTMSSQRLQIHRCGDSVFTSAAEGPGVRAVVRWLGIAVQWRVGPWPGFADQVEWFDLERGEPRGEKRLMPIHLPRYRDSINSGGVIPKVWISRDVSTPGPLVQSGPGGLLIVLGDQGFCLQPAK
jgi:outer membrane protein assembly factor BamB